MGEVLPRKSWLDVWLFIRGYKNEGKVDDEATVLSPLALLSLQT